MARETAWRNYCKVPDQQDVPNGLVRRLLTRCPTSLPQSTAHKGRDTAPASFNAVIGSKMRATKLRFHLRR